jgi:hypothetical protein
MMDKHVRATRALALVALLLLALAPVAALEFGFAGSVDNLAFPWNQLVPTPGTGPFPATNYVWGGEAFVGFALGDDAALRIEYELDPVLRNVLSTQIQFERGIAKISVGPYFGLFNSTASPFSVGLSTSVRFQWPGVAYASVRSDGALAIGALADALGAEPQARAELAAGIYTRNAIVSAVVSASSYSETDSGGLTVTDALSSYMLTIDLFKKNIPYTLLAEGGYELRSKFYEAAAKTDALGAIVLGVTATVEPTQGWKILASFRSGIFVLGLDNLKGRSPDQKDLFFNASLGLAFDTERLARAAAARSRVPAPKPEAAPAPAEATVAPDSELPPPIEAPQAEMAGPETRAASTGNFGLGAGAGLYYNFAPLPPGPFAFLAALFNVRGGVFVDGVYRFANHLGLGGEVGLQYINASLDSGVTSINIFDLPLRAKASYLLGPLNAELFLGLMTTGSFGTATSFDLGLALEGGGRLRLGALYLEGSYVLGLGGATSYPRAGLGFMMDLSKILGGMADGAGEGDATAPLPPTAPAGTSP